MSFASALNRRVKLQVRSLAVDEYGEQSSAWTDFVTDTVDHMVAASVKDVSGRQFVAAQATQNSVQTTITIRERPGVVAGMRVLHGDDVYDIETVLRVADYRLDLMAKRGVNNG